MQIANAMLLAAALVGQAAPGPAGDDPLTYVNQARRLSLQGKLDEALALYRKALAADPSLFEAHLGAGLVFDLKLQFTEARQHLSRALEIAPDEARVQAMNALAVSYAFEGNAREAASFYQKVFDRHVADANFSEAAATANALGRVYLETGDVPNARRWYQTGYETARRQPDEPASQRALWDFRWLHAQGRISARAGQIADARDQVRAARSLVDRTPELKDELKAWHYLAGYVELYAGDHARAVELLQGADEDDPFVLALLAQALERAGQPGRARDTWRAVLDFYGHSLQNAFARPAAMKQLEK